ncbi:MAG: serine--tRNA ligase [Candidatus Doudnabacteria bacterium RIFCSPHIGHO2_01_FULL_45_18]|uniref:Serine--tRNA ligase n=1 Tax=Candidatus Doudnabacteria bacterium RIFCSPHIGHO2_01_FULL_45_18 TaxID=1817823 RepID=A0A1F5NRI5_9BACT|nr:MAG: serine--tRNA ligase [Candidatus Doudnabacteria bacterium RIFCSPHIGHO2_01_FULL_45_18]
MLDIKYIRENPDKVRKAIKDKNGNVENLDNAIQKDNLRRSLIIDVEAIRSRRNQIAEKLKQDKDDALIEESKQLKERLTKLETELSNIEQDWKAAMIQIPNPALENVPVGNDETENKVLRKEGKPPKFSFKPKDHLELGEALDIIDVGRATKVVGGRFAYLKNQAAVLEFALIQFALSRLMKKGFQPILPPAVVKKSIADGLGYWQAGGNQNYWLLTDQETFDEGLTTKDPDPTYLIGTSEHSVVPMYKDETLPESELPKKYVAFSSCFRREAGSYGRDTRGILRVHQFDKLEMVAFVKPDQDEQVRKELLGVVEDMMKELELPYQVVALCTGDTAFPAAETIDIETWIPSQDKYRETHSISTTTDFQARRLNIKYQSKDERGFAHILNGTAIAMPRMIIAILENNQQEDGSIKIPKVLQEYTGFSEIKK